MYNSNKLDQKLKVWQRNIFIHLSQVLSIYNKCMPPPLEFISLQIFSSKSCWKYILENHKKQYSYKWQRLNKIKVNEKEIDHTN